MSGLRDDPLVGWCPRCRRLVFTARNEAERDRLRAEHDATTHADALPAQTIWTREVVKA